MNNEEILKKLIKENDNLQTRIDDQNHIMEIMGKKLESFERLIKNIDLEYVKINVMMPDLEKMVEVSREHNNSIKKIESILNDFVVNGIKSNGENSGEIDYNILVKKLVKSTRDIIEKEIEFNLKNRK